MILSNRLPLLLLLILTVLFPPFANSATRAAPHRSRPSALSLFPSPSLHIFFYAWYGAPPHDVGYLHWTHSVLPHWTPEVTKQHRSEPYVAPGDPGVTYYPARGLYSSHDGAVLEVQMEEMAEMGVDVVVVSWWGQKHKNSSVSKQAWTIESQCDMDVQLCSLITFFLLLWWTRWMGRVLEAIIACRPYSMQRRRRESKWPYTSEPHNNTAPVAHRTTAILC